MKKIMSLFFVLVLLFTFSASVVATNNPANAEYYAYMDITTASATEAAAILEARNEIIYSQTWVSDDASGYITNTDGSIETVPTFHELFPDDWAIPEVEKSEIEDANTLGMARTTNIICNKLVNVTYPSSTTTTDPFVSFSRSASNYYYSEVTTVGYRSSGYCNIGYSNATTGNSIGWASNLASGESFTIEIPTTVSKVAVRASTYYASGVGNWNMVVSGELD